MRLSWCFDGSGRWTFSENWQASGGGGREVSVVKAASQVEDSAAGGSRAAPPPAKDLCCGTLDRQKGREVNVLVFYKSFGRNYVLFMFIFECI